MVTLYPSWSAASHWECTHEPVRSLAADRALGQPPRAMSEIHDQVRLPPEPASAGVARRFVADALKARDIDVELIALLVSELVSNVILHAHTPLEVTVRTRGAHLRVTVADESPVIPAMKQYAADSVTGRGLTMIDLTAESWGIDEMADGKAVWFEIPLDGAVTQ